VDWKGIAGKLVALLVGLGVGFFGALNIVFSDSGSRAEFLQAVAVLAGVYFALGFAAGVMGPKTGWLWGVLIAGPGVVFVAVYAVMERAMLINVAIVAAASLVAACAGAGLGALIRRL
jgi:hypothetical protein